MQGVAFGGGLQVALGVDLRLLAADARLSVMEMRWGLVPDMAGIALLRDRVWAATPMPCVRPSGSWTSPPTATPPSCCWPTRSSSRA